MIGAFGGLASYNFVPGVNDLPALLALAVVLFFAVLTSVVFALVIERLAYRPLRNAPRLAPLITAIGVSLVLQELVRLYYFGDKVTTFTGAKTDRPFPKLVSTQDVHLGGGVKVPRVALFIIVLAILLMVALSAFVRRSKTGKAMQATAQDRDTAQLMGVNTDRVIVIAFVLGASLAGVAGVMQGLRVGAIGFRIGFLAGIKAFTAAVLGGIGNIAGAVLGGFIIGIVEVMATQYVPHGSAWKDVWAFVVLIVILVFRPQGLLGERVVNRA